jgi:hypothetical protein
MVERDPTMGQRNADAPHEGAVVLADQGQPAGNDVGVVAPGRKMCITPRPPATTGGHRQGSTALLW